MTTPKLSSTTPNNPPPRPRIGVGVFILRPTQTTTSSSPNSTNLEFIVGRRKGSHGAGTWGLPGGHLEMNESFETCATREVEEETGLRISNVRFLTATNDVMESEGKHYVTVFVVAEVKPGQEPELLEPEKCEAWEWVRWEDLVKRVEEEDETLFLPLVNIVKQRPGVVPLLY